MGTFSLGWRLFYLICLGFTITTFHSTDARSVISGRPTNAQVLSNSSCSDINVTPLSQSCDFDSGYCSFSHPTDSHGLEWRRTSSTSTLYAGVHSPHGGGSYIYPFMLGKHDGASSSINTTTINGGAVCIQFWYAMTQSTSNLEVLVDTNGQDRSLLKLSGRNGDDWRKASLAVSSQSPFKIRFKCKRINYDTKLGLDDIKIWKLQSTATTKPTATLAFTPTNKPIITSTTTPTTTPITTPTTTTATTPTTPPTTTPTTTTATPPTTTTITASTTTSTTTPTTTPATKPTTLPTKTPSRKPTTSQSTRPTTKPSTTMTFPVGSIENKDAQNDGSFTSSHKTGIIVGSVIGSCAVVLAALMVIKKARAAKRKCYQLEKSYTSDEYIPGYLKMKGMIK